MQKLTSMSKSQIVFSLFLLTFFFSCEKDTSTSNNTNPGTMTIEIDGVVQTPTSFNNTLLSLQQNGETGRRLDLRASIGSDMLIVTVANWNFQSPPTDGIITKIYDTNTNGTVGPNQSCTSLSGGTFCDSGLGTYIASGATFLSATMSSEPTGTITVSANNTTDKTVSGTFNFKVKQFGQSSAQPMVVTGSFSNLLYTVLN